MTPKSKSNEKHGGNLKEAERLFGVQKQGWLDLSTGINLKPYPNVELTNLSMQMLPQQEQMESLLAAARIFYNVPKGLEIIAAPGSQVLIQLLPLLSINQRVSILGPTYAEHARNWEEKGHKVSIVSCLADIYGAENAVIVNPNNPNGEIIKFNDLLKIANKEIDKNGLFIIDEAFADAQPETSIIPHLTNDLTIVLRSFGKFFGLPGIRLGFAIGSSYQVNLLKKKLGPWAVSGPALEIGARALSDDRWVEATRAELQVRCKKLDAILDRARLKVLGGTHLFRLIEYERAQMLFYHLGKLGIYVRQFPEYENWLRLGVPHSKSNFARLEEALMSALIS
jgi:cobalamin biosynthetic protein CobC